MTTKMSKNTHVVAFEKDGKAFEKKINDFQYDFYCEVYAKMPETISMKNYSRALAMFVIERLKQLNNFRESDVSIYVCSLIDLDKKLSKKMSLKNKEFTDLVDYCVHFIFQHCILHFNR